MKQKYNTLFFDLDNTLWDFERNSYYALKQTFFKYLGEKNNIEYDSFFACYLKNNEACWALYRKKEMSKKELVKERFLKTFKKFDIDSIDPVSFNDYYLEVMPLQKKLIDGTIDILKYLGSRYDMYIITNGFREVQYKKMDSSGLTPFFKRVFISEEVKSPKPNPEIFRHALTSSNSKKDKSLMIGDDLGVDVIGARNIGLDQVFFNPGATLPDKVAHEKINNLNTYTIGGLSQLKLFL